MRRVSLFLTERQIQGLAEAAKPEGLAVAALVRILISEGLKRRKNRAGK